MHTSSNIPSVQVAPTSTKQKQKHPEPTSMGYPPPVLVVAEPSTCTLIIFTRYVISNA